MDAAPPNASGAATDKGIWRSDDGGQTWTERTQGLPWKEVQGFAGGSDAAKNLVMLYCSIRSKDENGLFKGGLYLTGDGGQTWQRIGREGPQTFGGYFHPKRDGWIYMTLTEGAPGAGLWLSRDTGKTWRAFDELPFSNIQRVEFDPANDAVVHVTTFGGSVWRGPATPSEP